jgi:alanyl-tRNA synthetase
MKMMTSAEIRQSFLDFFQSRQHSIVNSSSLMPDSPNLLFTNAGMNQFVPIFLGQLPCPYQPGRAADTQKCIRAGGKHNDLEDVGLDTYHHTFFEMLGNWGFGNYFKKEAIEWAWELLTQVWQFPPARLFATVYSPDKSKNDPSEFDQEAWDIWAALFRKAGLDPQVHIVNGNKKDNFWMMGETGPCGPCSEVHIDLTPGGDTHGSLVNKGSAECIEIWNLVFMQFNANADGTFIPLPAQNVDTGMGFERVSGILQCTRGFTDFTHVISNYESDVFRPLFDELQKLSGKRYTSTLPAAGTTGASEQEKIDVAFRVIADHIRTLSFAIADGILPGNTDRNYVLRRILRRAVRYGRTLGFHQPFFYQLVDVLAEKMGDVFPEIRAKKDQVQQVIRAEEEAFNRTLDKGITLFNGSIVTNRDIGSKSEEVGGFTTISKKTEDSEVRALVRERQPDGTIKEWIDGEFAFLLYDTFGFPLDLTQLMAREQGLTVDMAGFEKLMAEQKARARAAQKKEIIEVSQIKSDVATQFLGYDQTAVTVKVQDVLNIKGRTAVILDATACYAEMGGQVGDRGELEGHGQLWRIVDTQKAGNAWLHYLEGAEAPAAGLELRLSVDAARRNAIQRHHTATHLLHWSLHKVVSPDAVQKGSFVGPDKLTFDFSSAALTPAQLVEVERAVNERIVENAPVCWQEKPYAEIKTHKEITQFFGEKYGEVVRVVQVGGQPAGLDGYSMELCGGTHVHATGDIGQFRIVAESSVSAGIRRIEAVCGMAAWEWSQRKHGLLQTLAQRLSAAPEEVPARIEALLEHAKKLEKDLKQKSAESARGRIDEFVAKAQAVGGVTLIAAEVGEMDADTLRGLHDGIREKQPDALIVLGGHAEGKASFVTSASEALVKQGVHCGKLIGAVAKIAGGGGGGKPDKAQAGGKDVTKIAEAIRQVPELLAAMLKK